MTLIKSVLYEKDYAVWVEQTVQSLRQGIFDSLDIDNLIDEVEDLGKSQRQALKSNLRVLLMHLLKWQYQSEHRSGSWKGTIREHRNRIVDILEDSPSLKRFYAEAIDQCYGKARLQAADETGLAVEVFPETYQYNANQILDDDFWPN